MIVISWYPFSHDWAIRSHGYRHRVTLTLKNLVVLIYWFANGKTRRCLETTSINLLLSYDLHTVPRVHGPSTGESCSRLSQHDAPV
jgi:hypothetical protein